MITMYGIPNCDKIKKAKVWLEKHNAEYKFYNYNIMEKEEFLSSGFYYTKNEITIINDLK